MIINTYLSIFNFPNYRGATKKNDSINIISTRILKTYDHINYHKFRKSFYNIISNTESISGSLVDKEANFCPYTTIYLYNLYGIRVDFTVTDELGKYTFYGLEKDTSYVLVSKHRENKYNTVTQLVIL